MADQHYDWSQFTISFYYPVPVQTLYRSWATSRGLASFFIEQSSLQAGACMRGPEELAQAGDRYNWQWRHAYELSGDILEACEDSRLAFTFGAMTVAIDFRPTREGSMLFLRQTDIAADDRPMGHLNCRSCWVFFLTNLKSVLLTGTDLRDRDPGTVSSMEVGFVPAEPGNTSDQ